MAIKTISVRLVFDETEVFYYPNNVPLPRIGEMVSLNVKGNDYYGRVSDIEHKIYDFNLMITIWCR